MRLKQLHTITRIVFPIFFLSFLTMGICAQSTLIKGMLVDAETEAVLGFAAVGAYNVKDSSLVNSTMTDDAGKFEISLNKGNYYLLIQYIGYVDKYVANIQCNGSFPEIDLQQILMTSEAFQLEEVVVSTERSQLEMKLDKRVFNVGKDLTNAGNSAADILDNVPSISVDPEGNVSLRGSEGVRILVNGRPSGLISAGDTEALLRMQGDIIESIEVITNPSARYEAEGEAGIINIILKKNQQKGLNGSFSATAGNPHNYGASYNINYLRNRFNLFSSFGIDYRKSPGGGESSQKFFENGMQTSAYTADTDQERGGIGGYFQVGTDWNISDNKVLTGALLYRRRESDNNANVTYRDFDATGSLTNRVLREILEEETSHNLEASLLYKQEFAVKDRTWTVDLKYILDDDTEIADYKETNTDLIDPLLQHSSNTEDEINILFQSDYVHPFGENAKFETGVRASFRSVNNDFFVEEQNDQGVYEILDGFDDFLEYDENIYAAYVIGAQQWGDFSLQAGLRAEYSDIKAALLRSQAESNQEYTSLFPSASATYKITDKDQFQVSYSRRLSRPRFRLLLPFSNFNDPRNNPVGNPNLRPEFTNAFEVGHLHYFENGTLLTSVYYRHTTGVIQRIIRVEEGGITTRYPINLADRDSYGIEGSFSYSLTENWDFNMDANFFRAQVMGDFEGVSYESDTYSFNGRATTKLDISKSMQAQLSYRYRAPEKTTQGRRLSSGSLDIAASLDVLKGNGTITLSGRDLLNQRKWRNEVDLPDYQSESEFQWRRSQSVVLSFNYRLNKAKEKRDLIPDGQNDDG